MSSEMKNDQGLLDWQLRHLATSIGRAKELEKRRSDYHEELHQNIAYSTVHYDRAFMGVVASPAVEAQAFSMIERKERFDRRIQAEYGRFNRWQDLLDYAGSHDRLLLQRYYQKGKPLRPDIVARLLNRLSGRVAEEEAAIEAQRQKLSIERYLDYMAKTEAFRKVAVEPIEEETKRQYFIRGKFQYLTAAAHDEHLHQQAEAEERREYYDVYNL